MVHLNMKLCFIHFTNGFLTERHNEGIVVERLIRVWQVGKGISRSGQTTYIFQMIAYNLSILNSQGVFHDFQSNLFRFIIDINSRYETEAVQFFQGKNNPLFFGEIFLSEKNEMFLIFSCK